MGIQAQAAEGAPAEESARGAAQGSDTLEQPTRGHLDVRCGARKGRGKVSSLPKLFCSPDPIPETPWADRGQNRTQPVVLKLGRPDGLVYRARAPQPRRAESERTVTDWAGQSGAGRTFRPR
jgi:hypothetical protein